MYAVKHLIGRVSQPGDAYEDHRAPGEFHDLPGLAQLVGAVDYILPIDLVRGHFNVVAGIEKWEESFTIGIVSIF
jgi:hypothetical protein